MIYITPHLANKWFGVSFSPNLQDSVLHLESPKELPFKQRLQRQNRKISAQRLISSAQNPLLKQPYSLLALPSLDIRLNHLARRQTTGANKTYNHSTYYSTISTGDFLGMSTQTLFTGLQEDGISNATIKMDRYDHTQSMLGILGLSQISIGDVSHPTFSGAPGSYGRGIVISNSPTHNNSNRDIRDIEGDYLPNWDVELYLAGTLIGFMKTDDTGHYLFKDVVLFEGNNTFTLKFYGPNGRIETKTRNISVGAKVNSKHKVSYSLSLSQPQRKVYEIQENTSTDNIDKEHIEQSIFTSEIQVVPRLSFNMGLLNRRIEDKEDKYYNLGMRAHILNTRLNLSATSLNEEDPTYTYNMSGLVLDTIYSLNISQSAFYKNRSLALNRKIGKTGSFIMRSTVSKGDLSSTQNHRVGLSGRAKMISWNNILEYQSLNNLTNPEENYEELTGALFFSASFRPISIRTNISYNLLQEQEIRSLSLSTTSKLDSKTKIHFTANRDLISNSTNYRLSMNWQLNSMIVTPSIYYGDNGLMQGSIGISASLGHRNGRVGNYYHLSAQPALSKGTVKARLFEDRNQDSKYQLGEPLLGGAELYAEQSRRKAISNKGGIAWLGTLPIWKPTDITVIEDSLDADAMTQSTKPFSLVPRPGKVIEVDIPFTRVGDMDGTVYRQESNELKPARGITVLLKDTKKEVVQKQITDSDGYFDFTKIAPGVHTLSITGETIVETTHSEITITPQGNYVAGVEITIDKAPVTISPLDSLFSEENDLSINQSTQVEVPPKALVSEAFAIDSVPTLIAEPVTLKEPRLKEKEDSHTKEQSPATINTEQDNNYESKTLTENKGKWSLQAASYSNKLSAKKFVTRIIKNNQKAFIRQAKINNTLFHRVYIGHYATRNDAIKAKQSIDSTFNIKSIVSKPQ